MHNLPHPNRHRWEAADKFWSAVIGVIGTLLAFAFIVAIA